MMWTCGMYALHPCKAVSSKRITSRYCHSAPIEKATNSLYRGSFIHGQQSVPNPSNPPAFLLKWHSAHWQFLQGHAYFLNLRSCGEHRSSSRNRNHNVSAAGTIHDSSLPRLSGIASLLVTRNHLVHDYGKLWVRQR